MKNYIIGALLIIGLGVGLYYTFLGGGDTQNLSSKIEIVKNDINLGEIPMDEGKINIPFEFINTGDQDIILGNAETSCMCTEGYITDINGGNKSSIIKMSGHGGINILNRVIKPKEKIILNAVFDPNAHGPDAIGPISRNVYIDTNSSIISKLDFRFLGNVVKTRTINETLELDNNLIEKELFTFEEKSFDFGTIKQSGGKVNHEFKFTYNGDEPIKITGVPTSCACTSATIDKTELQPGDTGLLTVNFNPNLHEEPKGRFFKTISLLTDKELEEIPEIKIWTEIDLDLGPDAFELKGDHDESKESTIVTLNAKKWEYDKKVIKVKKGEKLIIKVNNSDILHGIAIPDMQLVGDDQIEVDTSKVGEFEFRCANYCGEGHQEMVGKLIIE